MPSAEDSSPTAADRNSRPQRKKACCPKYIPATKLEREAQRRQMEAEYREREGN